MSLSANSAAALIARFLKARGVDRAFGLCGGHIMPIWMCIDAEGIAIVDVRDERAAVYMAHAYGELTGGLGVALVTAGPGVTNAMTGIANAYVARAPVLVLSGVPPRPQENRGALQDLVHTDMVRPITRYARTVREPSLVLQELDEAVARAFGAGGEPGPVYLDFPTDTLRAEVPRALQREEHLRPKPRPAIPPEPAALRAAAELLASARRPLVISGRGARGAAKSLLRLLDWLGAPYLDTGESRGLVPDSHPAGVAAMRGTVMGEADVVLTVGRRLDFQLAYGSPAVFGEARFVRIADVASELRDNRRGEVELFASCAATLEGIVEVAGGRAPAIDREWARALRARHEERARKLRAAMRDAPCGRDGRMHPNRLLACLQDRIGNDAVVVADGGDVLSFARVGLAVATWLDPGPLGCIGVGTAFGIAASFACPDRPVVVVTGDG
ncbi:MAG: thiamine pyrophosphate-binding protein, partial [Betaproteobacteria bacterium]